MPRRCRSCIDTVWGKIRKDLGHEAPFCLKYIGIGNEEVGDGFFERYPYFHKAIREKYPEIQIINTAGPFASGESYEAGWCSAKKYGSDLVDEHYYSAPEWFLANMHHYEDYDENGPKVFLGEYASWGNTYYNALVEAAYMTHLERSRQRLFHVEDIEYFLELEVEDRRIRTWVNGILYNDAVDRLPELEELYVTASVNRNSDRTILKAVNLTGEAKEVQLILDGAVKNAVTVTCLKGCGLDETNSFENPDNITPQTEHISVDKNEMSYVFVPHSVTILSFGNVG